MEELCYRKTKSEEKRLTLTLLLLMPFTRAVSFPRHSLTDSLIYAAEGAEDSVTMFTSLVRDRFP